MRSSTPWNSARGSATGTPAAGRDAPAVHDLDEFDLDTA